MTAGPTPVPPAVSQAMAAPMLYHRAPAFDELYERVLGRLPARVRHRQPGARVRRERLRRDGVGGRQPRPPRHARRSRWPPASSASAGSSCARPTAPTLVKHEPGWGVRFDPAEVDRAAGGEPRRRGRVRHAQRDVDRDRARRAARSPRSCAATTRCSSSTPSRASAPTRLEQDDWGIDVVVAGSQKALMTPPGLAFASVSERALAAAAAKGGGRYYFDWAPDREEPGEGREPVHAGRLAVPRARRRARDDRGGGAGERLGPPRPARPRDARRRARARPRPVRRPGRALDRRDRDRAARRRRRRQGARHAAQARHHRQRRPGPPQGPHPADRALRLLRRVRHPHLALRPGDRAPASSATTSTTAPASAPPSACSSRPASSPRREPLPRRAVPGPGRGADRRFGRGAAA